MATTKKPSASELFAGALQEVVVQEPPRHVTAIQNGRIETSEAGNAAISYSDDNELALAVPAANIS